jgi:RNA polymerase sigma factor (sigma-70 family)
VTDKIAAKFHDEISEFARQYNKPLYGHLFRFAQGDHALAQDVVQQVLMEAAQSWARIRALDDSGQWDWLQRTASRRAIDAFRKNSRARINESRAVAAYAPPETDPHALAVTAVAIERFVSVIESLPPRQAQAATLYWRCGWKNAEIAEGFGITRGAVTRLLRKAATTIRTELGPYLAAEPCDPEGGA